jgi:hypothetical protein
MIAAIVFAVSTVLSSGPAQQDSALSACLANLSNLPEYKDKTSDQLASDQSFLQAAVDDWCSDELSSYWDVAHARARKQLGAPEEGYPVSGQQRLAEQNMTDIVAEAWRNASLLRSKPPALSASKWEEWGLVWLLDRAEDQSFTNEIEPPIFCVAKRLRADSSLLEKLKLGDGMTIKLSDLGPLAAACGYDQEVHSVARMVQAEFTQTGGDFSSKAADSFLGKMLFQVMLSAGD